MKDIINDALDMGCRVISIDGVLSIQPPAGEEFQGSFVRVVGVPSGLESWVAARKVVGPDEQKRHDIEAKVKTWLKMNYKKYVEECEDEVYARGTIVLDAAFDFDTDIEDVKDWMEEVCKSG